MTDRPRTPLFSVLQMMAAAGAAGLAVACACPVAPSLAEAEARIHVTDTDVDCSGADEWIDTFEYVAGDGDWHEHVCTVDCVELNDGTQAQVTWTWTTTEDKAPRLEAEDIDRSAARCEC